MPNKFNTLSGTSIGTLRDLSAAMPALTGAIFRKGGVHASLRTEPAGKLTKNTLEHPIKIDRKPFNIITMERDAQILNDRCITMVSAFGNFLTCRPALLPDIKENHMNQPPFQSETMSTPPTRSNYGT
jgi:hypothetical protein